MRGMFGAAESHRVHPFTEKQRLNTKSKSRGLGLMFWL